MVDYKVQVEVFEGPLDLLLYLVRKEEVDIYQVNLTKLATQFIEYVELMQELDLEVASEFLVMAATLLHIKSRELLPVDRRPEDDAAEEEGEDPRWELIRKLVEYKKFKDAAARLQAIEEEQARVYARRAPRLAFETPPPPLQVSVFQLLEAVNEVLQRFRARHEANFIEDDPWTVSGKMEEIRARLRERPRVRFRDLFARAGSRNEVVATFLALLELIRLRVVTAFQEQPFSDIEIAPAAPEPEPPPVGAAAASDQSGAASA